MKRVIFTILVAAAALALASTAFAQEKEWVRVWPCEADGAATVRDAGGGQHPSTGEGANTWFSWGGAGTWKRFKVKKGVPVIIKALGDSGPGACLGHVAFRCTELDKSERKGTFVFDGPNWSGVAPKGEPCYRLVYHVPKTDKLEISCVKGGFYVWVYRQRQVSKKDNKLSEEDTQAALALIEKLGCDCWHERQKAQRALVRMGEAVLPLLQQEKNKPRPVLEVRLRIRKIIAALTPLTGETYSEEAMKNDVEALLTTLAVYIGAKSLGCDSEPAKSLAAPGPYAVKHLVSLTDPAEEENSNVRAAAVNALGRLADKDSVKTILSALKDDKDEEVRFQAAGALASFDSEEVRKALKASSENDKSEKVAKRAAEVLAQIKNKKLTDKEDK
jgi:hypothetical protein